MDENKNTVAMLSQSPVALLLLGACPAMALTTELKAALTLGLAATAVMLLTALVMWALKGLLSPSARLACCVIVTTFFVSAAELLLNAYLPKLYSLLGIYLALCAVNLMVLSAGESACCLNLGKALSNALLMGISFTLTVLLVAAIRELFGSGSLAGNQIAFFKTHSVAILAQAPGGFMIYAFAAAAAQGLCPKSLRDKGFTLAAAGLDKEEAE